MRILGCVANEVVVHVMVGGGVSNNFWRMAGLLLSPVRVICTLTS